MSSLAKSEIKSKIDAFIANCDVYKIELGEYHRWTVWNDYNIASYGERKQATKHDEYWRLFTESIDKGDILIAQTDSGDKSLTFGIGKVSKKLVH